MGANDRAVDHRVLVVGLARQAPEEPFPHAALGPSAEPGVHLLPGTEPLRQVPPGNAGAVAVEHRLDEQAIVLGRHADVSLAARQQALDPVPLVIA